MAHAIWKGSLRFGLVNVPVGIYPAEDADELSFTLLDRRDLSPVGYQRINKSTGEEVDWDDIVKGYEYEEGEYVVLGDEDFKRANPEATQTVDILAFVDASEIDPVYFDRPYYLAPTKGGDKGYAILREALAETGKAGIAKVVLRTREHLSAVLPRGKALILELLRFEHELRDEKGLDLPGESLSQLKVTKREIEMAGQLVNGMVEPWDPSQYQDEYRDDLMARIKEKVKKGETEVIPEPEEEEGEKEPQVIDIMDLLKRSLAETGGKERGRPKSKARAKKKAPARKKERKRA
jgi:DNA end-binding protein Ku